ncbi:MAG: tRNA pseudouridine(55) synthase, partial [Bacteroidota bacterium]
MLLTRNMLPPTKSPPFTFAEGNLLLVDKPKGWTSFDVVNKLRWAIRKHLGVKKFKVGHAGTLDPMATGLLNICTGKWTKRLQELQGLDKSYTGTITLGATTASYDAEEPIDATYPTDHITEAMILEAAASLTGHLQQLPPIYSAIKVDGQPLYKKARNGQKVEVKPR